MNGPTAPCPACQQRSFERVIGVNSVTIWRCAVCGLGTTVPRPTEANGHDSFLEDPAYFASVYAQPKDRWWQRFNDAPLDLLQKAGTIPGQRFLDVGCSIGYLVAKAQGCGYEASGLDGSPAAVAFGREHLRLNLVCARIESADIEASSQDIVVMSHVLEHLPEPVTVLKRVRDWLKPGGLLLIGVPNFASPIARWSRERWSGLVPTQHIWHFTPDALTRVVAAADFKRIRWTTRMLVHVPCGVAGWAKWVIRRILEPLRLADNVLLLARRVVGSEGK
jgi:SAM-dependent methyltransferase